MPTRLLPAAFVLCLPLIVRAEPPKSVAAVVETTLTTDGGQIRQFAFDGDPASYFASKKFPVKGDHFTLVFDKPVALKVVTVTTGKPDGGDALDAGLLETSANGKTFSTLAKFADGTAHGNAGGVKVKLVRLRATGDLGHPLAIREFKIESDPPVAAFKYPIEFVVDTTEAPDLKDWAEKTARVCEQQYPMICEELASDGFTPVTQIRLTLKPDYRGVAAASGSRITGSARYFKDHPDDVGAMVHETVHCVQLYRGRGNPNPGWLVEGVADYIRFFKYEPGKLRPLAPERAKYDGNYRVTAAFLAFVTEKYEKNAVRKLNQAMREGKYSETVWKDLTGKTLEELGQAWKASLAK
jgi:hypothetical protein